MGKVKDFRLFIAEDLCTKNKMLDLDKAFVMVDDLWDRAAVKKDVTAQVEIGKYVKRYREG